MPFNHKRRGLVRGNPYRFYPNHHTRKPRSKSRIVFIEGKRYATISLQDGTEAIVNIADYRRACKYTWQVNGRGAVHADICGRRVSLHKFIVGRPRIDHKNHNGRDNRRCNLRPADQIHNLRNSRKKIGCKSIYKGVVLHDSGLWRASIKALGRVIRLGYFRDEKQAAYAYDDAARKYFRKFACVNFPKKGEQGASR